MPVGKTEVIKWKSKDGREIEGLLTYPVGYTPGKKVPFISQPFTVGRAGNFNQSYIGGGALRLSGWRPLHREVTSPFCVRNPRGSSGYGTEFRRANERTGAEMDYQDLMTGRRQGHRNGRRRPNKTRRDGLGAMAVL